MFQRFYDILRSNPTLMFREFMKLDEAGVADREEKKKEMERVKSAR